MSQRTYRATGINLKSMPLGEADRLITILTKEEGLIRAVAKGARKQPSKLGGRMEPFVVNDLMLSRGRRTAHLDPQSTLQRIAQAETLHSFTYLRRSLTHLTAAQYLAEVVLALAISSATQEDLFVLLVEHLQRLEQARDPEHSLPLLTHGLYHLLALAGVAPQVYTCQICQTPVSPQPDRDVHFSLGNGGLVCDPCTFNHRIREITLVSPTVLKALQQLPNPQLPTSYTLSTSSWLGAESLLRRAIEAHTERPIQSSTLIDNCWPGLPIGQT